MWRHVDVDKLSAGQGRVCKNLQDLCCQNWSHNSPLHYGLLENDRWFMQCLHLFFSWESSWSKVYLRTFWSFNKQHLPNMWKRSWIIIPQFRRRWVNESYFFGTQNPVKMFSFRTGSNRTWPGWASTNGFGGDGEKNTWNYCPKYMVT